MRRIVALALALSFLALGTGLAEFLHNASHDREDRARLAAVAADAPIAPDAPDHHAPLHDESNCRIHAVLHGPLVAGAWAPLLVCLGLFVAFLTLHSPPLVARRVPLRIACRGPPAC